MLRRRTDVVAIWNFTPGTCSPARETLTTPLSDAIKSPEQLQLVSQTPPAPAIESRQASVTKKPLAKKRKTEDNRTSSTSKVLKRSSLPPVQSSQFHAASENAPHTANPLGQMDRILSDMTQAPADPLLLVSALRVISRMCATLYTGQRDMKRSLREIVSRGAPETDAQSPPFTTAETVDQFERFLAEVQINPTLKPQAVRFLFLQGGSDLREKVKRMCEKLASMFVLSHYNRTGKGNKACFKRAEDLIKDALFADAAGASVTHKEAEKAVEAFLSDAPYKRGGTKDRSLSASTSSTPPAQPGNSSLPAQEQPRYRPHRPTAAQYSSRGADAFPVVYADPEEKVDEDGFDADDDSADDATYQPSMNKH